MLATPCNSMKGQLENLEANRSVLAWQAIHCKRFPHTLSDDISCLKFPLTMSQLSDRRVVGRLPMRQNVESALRGKRLQQRLLLSLLHAHYGQLPVCVGLGYALNICPPKLVVSKHGQMCASSRAVASSRGPDIHRMPAHSGLPKSQQHQHSIKRLTSALPGPLPGAAARRALASLRTVVARIATTATMAVSLVNKPAQASKESHAGLRGLWGRLQGVASPASRAHRNSRSSSCSTR